MLKLLKDLLKSFKPKKRTFAEIDVQRYMQLHIDLLRVGFPTAYLPSMENVSYYYPATLHIGKWNKRIPHTVWIHRITGVEEKNWRTPVFPE